jgi:hypothetical protein
MSPRTYSSRFAAEATSGRDHERLALALLVSLLIHMLLLSLTFGVEGRGLPGFGFPWRDRRIDAPALGVVLVSTRTAAVEPAVASVVEPSPPTSIDRSVASKPARTPSVGTAPVRREEAVPTAPPARIAAEARSKKSAGVRPAAPAAPAHPDGIDRAAPAQVEDPAVVDVAKSDPPASVGRTDPPAPTPVIAVAPSTSMPETVTSTLEGGDAAREGARGAAERTEAQRQEVARQEEAARLDAARLDAEREDAAQRAAAELEAQRQEAARQEEAARLEAVRLAAEREEAARQTAAQLEAQRQEAARQEEAARLEAVRLAAEREEAARRTAAQLEAQRQEAARQEEAARLEASRLEAARLAAEREEAARRTAAELEARRQEVARQKEAERLEAARREAEREEAVRLAAARQEAARISAEQEETARREAVRRAIGRQLDEEAAQREKASAGGLPSSLPLSLSTARRIRLWGRADPNVEVIRYAEAWERKIQSNTSADTVREVARQPHTHPMVTVAIRSDGSVESVTFVLSSGVAEVDEKIRRIVQSHQHYAAFPPALARDVDVIEIRRTWYFDASVRLY